MDKFILDACCGGRCFWVNKTHPNTIYIDQRRAEKGHVHQRPGHSVEPDIIMDFSDLNFPDKQFRLIVWDPPHLLSLGETSVLRKKYGCLISGWEETLRDGFSECWRVLQDYGVLVFKWNEEEISRKKVLSLFPVQPLFGHPVGSKNKTHWFTFMKIPAPTAGGF